ncbi:DNA polymerase III subunit gamma/tau, partial [Magnetococcales bacterium HHB-1]
MTYTVLARKWRPQKFDALVGQNHVTRALSHALKSGRVPHAFLFCGIRGVGKTTLARILAMCLNCESGVTATPCGECASCRDIATGDFPDVFEIDAASRTKVEQMREILDLVNYKPSSGRFKVYILDEIHMLSTHAFNALLKTLEEPPAHVKFIFATTEVAKIPATIVSRCQRFDLKRVSEPDLGDYFRYLLKEEGLSFDDEGVAAVASAADGSVRDGLSILEQVIAHGGGEIRFEALKDLLGLAEQEVITKLLSSMLGGQAEQMLDLLSTLHQNGGDASMVVNGLLETTHQLARAKVGGVKNQPESAALQGLVTETSMEHLQMLYQTLLRGEEDIRRARRPMQA